MNMLKALWNKVTRLEELIASGGGGGASLPSPQVNIFDYGVSVSDMGSPIVIPQGTAFWEKLLEIKNAGLVPEVEIVTANHGQTAYVSCWMYQGGETPIACACAGKTLSGTEVVDAYAVMQYDAGAGTVTMLHNLA